MRGLSVSYLSQRPCQRSEDSLRAFVGGAGVLGVPSQQDIRAVTEALRNRMHGDSSVEQRGRVGDPQIVKSQSGEAEFAELRSYRLGQPPRVAYSCEVEPPTEYPTGGKDQCLGRQPNGAQAHYSLL